ncbi:MAG: hypothetical protein ACP5MG_04895 [Verrucomicrobiia bacterium]
MRSSSIRLFYDIRLKTVIWQILKTAKYKIQEQTQDSKLTEIKPYAKEVFQKRLCISNCSGLTPGKRLQFYKRMNKFRNGFAVF